VTSDAFKGTSPSSKSIRLKRTPKIGGIDPFGGFSPPVLDGEDEEVGVRRLLLHPTLNGHFLKLLLHFLFNFLLFFRDSLFNRPSSTLRGEKAKI
jgi:hypothetical protein